MLLHMAAPMGIGVPYFVDGVVLSFECALAKVEGYELGGDVGYEGVAHGEEQFEWTGLPMSGRIFAVEITGGSLWAFSC